MRVDYDRRIARAGDLTATYPESADLLLFYRGLAQIQKTIFDTLCSNGETAVSALTGYFARLIEYAERAAPPQIAALGRPHLDGALLNRYWEGDRTSPAEAQFFARVLLQPYAESLASRGTPDLQATTPVCPFCSAKPAVGVLRGEGEGARRSLLCSLCSTEWLFRRVVCPGCGEEDKDRLPVYIAGETSYVRIDACDTCRTYLKSIDLTKNGHAVPVVDELATVALNIWAEERDYVKLEANVLGM